MDYLVHHGVKGMKWGVRHDKERAGNLRGTATKAITKPGFGTSARTEQKITKFEGRISRTGEKTVGARALNDWRRGRVRALNAKAQHRRAKENYLKTVAPTFTKNKTASDISKKKAAKKTLNAARKKRITSVALQSVTAPDQVGSYMRYRKAGSNAVSSYLKMVGSSTIGSVPRAVGAGKTLVSDAIHNRR